MSAAITTSRLRAFSVAISPATAAFFLALVFLSIRLFFVLHHEGMWGVDGGAYLLSRDAVLGLPQIADFPRPPLAPGWTLVPFTTLFGDNMGLRLWAVAVTLPVIPAYWLFVRRFLSPWQAVAALFIFLADWKLAEMFTAGPLPILAFTGLFLMLWAVAELKEHPSLKAWAIIALGIPFIAAANQTSTGITAIVLPVFALALRVPLKRLFPPVATGFLFCVPLFPYYAAVTPGSSLMRYPGPLLTFLGWPNFAWMQATMGLIISGLALWKGHGVVRATAAVLLVLSFTTPMLSYDESIENVLYRGSYLHSALLGLLALWVAIRLVWPSKTLRPLVFAYTPILAVVLSFGYLIQLQAESKLGRMVTPETAAAIEWVKAQPDAAGTRIASNSYSLANYIAAMTRQPVVWLHVWEPPAAYAEQHRQVACLVGWVDCDPSAAAQELNTRYLIVERIWPTVAEDFDEFPDLAPVTRFLDRFSGWEKNVGMMWNQPNDTPWVHAEKRAPWLTPVWEQGTTIVWRVDTWQ